MIVDKINAYLTENNLKIDNITLQAVEKLSGWSFERQFMRDSERDHLGKLYLSSAGKCARQLAYGYHGYEKAGKTLDSRSKIVFWMGDMVELTIVALARLSGVQMAGTGLNQITLEFQINGTTLSGHPDGLVIGDKIRLLEVKSMSSYAFAEFQRGEISEEYITQINCYMHGLGIDECVFVAICKDSGVLHEMIIKKDQAVVDAARVNLLSVVHSTKENLPERKFKANDKGVYPWQCLFCAYWKHCHEDAEVVFDGKKKNILRQKKQQPKEAV